MPSSPPTGARPVRRGLRLGVLAATPAVVGVLVLLPDQVGLDRWLPFTVFAALRPALTVAEGVVLLLAAATAPLFTRGLRRAPSGAATRRALGIGLAGGAVTVVVAAALVVPRAVADPAPPPGGTELTVLELNVYEGHADVAALAGIIAGARPDLVVFPEAGDRFRRAIAARAPGYRSWTNVPPGTPDVRGIVILASPRAGAVTAQPIDGDTRYPWAELTGGILGPTRLGAIHLASVIPQWIRDWPGELAQLQRWCGPDAGSAMVVGDLNATPDHSAFRSGTAGCTDATTARGESLTASWRSTWPRWFGAQIDHVLTRGGPQARSVEVVDVPGSDHRALLVSVRL